MPSNSPRTEDINEIIARLLGLSNASILDDQTYFKKILNRLAIDGIGGKKLPAEESQLLREELKIFRRKLKKPGRFKVRVKKVTIGNSTPPPSKSSSDDTDGPKGGPGPQKSQGTKLLPSVGTLVPYQKIQRQKPKEESVDKEVKIKRESPGLKILQEINDRLGSILNTLKSQYAFDQKQSEKSRKESENQKRSKGESKLEKGFGALKSIAAKTLAPFQSIFDKIWRWLFFTLLGRAFNDFMNWVSDAGNRKKISNIFKFFTTHWVAFAGIYLLFGTSLGKFVRGIMKVVARGLVALAMNIPRIVSFIRKNKKLGFLALAAAPLVSREVSNIFSNKDDAKTDPGDLTPREFGETKSANDDISKQTIPKFNLGGMIPKFNLGGMIPKFKLGGMNYGSFQQGVPISGAGQDNTLIAAKTGEAILTEKDQKHLYRNYANIQTGENLNIPKYLSGRKPGKVSSDKIKVRGGYFNGGVIDGFAKGGVVGNSGLGNFGRMFNGLVDGPSGIDKVDAKLSKNEFVMSAGAVKKYGADTFKSMNAAGGGTNRIRTIGGIPHAWGGGLITDAELRSQAAAQSRPTGGVQGAREYKFSTNNPDHIANYEKLKRIAIKKGIYQAPPPPPSSRPSGSPPPSSRPSGSPPPSSRPSGSPPPPSRNNSSTSLIRRPTSSLSTDVKTPVQRVNTNMNVPGGRIRGGSLSAVMMALEMKQRKDQGQTNAQAGLGAGASALGGQLGWMGGAKAGAIAGAALGSIVPGLGTGLGAAVGAVVGGLAGGFGGAALGGKLADDFSGVNAKKERASRGVGGKVVGGWGLKDQSFKDAPKTSIITDDKGRPSVGYKALKNGKLTYVRRPTPGTGTSNPLEMLGRFVNPNAYKQSDAKISMQHHKEAMVNALESMQAQGMAPDAQARMMKQMGGNLKDVQNDLDYRKARQNPIPRIVPTTRSVNTRGSGARNTAGTSRVRYSSRPSGNIRGGTKTAAQTNQQRLVNARPWWDKAGWFGGASARVKKKEGGGIIEQPNVRESISDQLKSLTSMRANSLERQGRNVESWGLKAFSPYMNNGLSFSKGFITENTGMNIPGGTSDRQAILVQPGEYVIPKGAIAGFGGVDALDKKVAEYDKNSNPFKMGALGNKLPKIEPYKNSNSGKASFVELPPITQSMSGTGGAMPNAGGTSEVFFSPIHPASISERKRILDTMGVG